MVKMYQKALVGLSYSRKGFEVIKDLSLSFPNIKLVYVNRRWNTEADSLAKQGLRRNVIIKGWF